MPLSSFVNKVTEFPGKVSDFFSKRKEKKDGDPGLGRFSVETLKSHISKTRGLASPNLFGVEIYYTPRKKAGASTEDTSIDTVTVEAPGEPNKVGLLAYAANLPGVSALVTDVRRQGYGPLERRITGLTFNDLNVTFLLDNNGDVLHFFDRWLREIYSYSKLPGEGSVDEITGGTLGQVGFYDDYVGTIKITMYDAYTQKIATYTLIDAFPGQVNQVDLSWRQVDEIAELQVTFYYRHYNVEIFEAAETEKSKGKRMNLLQFASKLKSAIDIVKNTRTPRSVGEALDVLNNGRTIWKGFGG